MTDYAAVEGSSWSGALQRTADSAAVADSWRRMPTSQITTSKSEVPRLACWQAPISVSSDSGFRRRLLGDYRQFMPNQPLRQYLHGSKAALRPGDTVLPPSGKEWGRTTAPMMPGAERLPDADDWVYLTTDLNGAWLYAYDSGGPGEPAVYIVIPTSGTMRDPEYAGSPMPAYRCRAAIVLSVDRKPPFSQEEAARKWIQVDPMPAIRSVRKPDRVERCSTEQDGTVR